MKAIQHAFADKESVTFKFTIIDLIGIPAKSNQPLRCGVKWKRGDKQNGCTTVKSMDGEGNFTWNESFSCSCTMFRKGGNTMKKNLKLYVIQDPKKSQTQKVIGAGVVDLSVMPRAQTVKIDLKRGQAHLRLDFLWGAASSPSLAPIPRSSSNSGLFQQQQQQKRPPSESGRSAGRNSIVTEDSDNESEPIVESVDAQSMEDILEADDSASCGGYKPNSAPDITKLKKNQEQWYRILDTMNSLGRFPQRPEFEAALNQCAQVRKSPDTMTEEQRRQIEKKMMVLEEKLEIICENMSSQPTPSRPPNQQQNQNRPNGEKNDYAPQMRRSEPPRPPPKPVKWEERDSDVDSSVSLRSEKQVAKPPPPSRKGEDRICGISLDSCSIS